MVSVKWDHWYVLSRIIKRLMYEDNGRVYETQEEIPFYAKQTRLVLKNCGHIDAEHIEDAIAVGAYEAFEKAVFEMTPEAVIKTVTDAGLRGRGGAGFPAGKKWSQVAGQKETVRLWIEVLWKATRTV